MQPLYFQINKETHLFEKRTQCQAGTLTGHWSVVKSLTLGYASRLVDYAQALNHAGKCVLNIQYALYGSGTNTIVFFLIL